MRTDSRFESSQPFTDAYVSVSPQDVLTSFAAAADGVLTRNAAGDWSINQLATKTNIYAVSTSRLICRTGLGPDLQEMFGTAAGVAGPSSVANTWAPSAKDGRPPFTGATQLVPQTTFTPKGLNLVSIAFVYRILTANLTAHTCRVDKVVYANGVAIAITSVLASGANGLATAFTANPYVTVVTIAPGFLITSNSEIIVEQSVQTATGTFQWEAMMLRFQYNYN